jgi:hypothetical protein
MAMDIQFTLIASLFGLGVLWSILVAWTFRRLRLHHEATYRDLGSPSLFRNNAMKVDSISKHWLFVKYLFQGDWQSSGDSALAVVVRLMQLVFVVFNVGFLSFFIAFLFRGN